MTPCALRSISPKSLDFRREVSLWFAAALLLGALTPHMGISGENRISDQIAAGEFGPAIDAATSLPNLEERAVELRKIGDAQRAAGDFAGARATARLLPRREERALAAGQAVRERSASGGANVADFTELIDLIQSTVDPSSWEDLGGVGSMRPYNTGVFVDPQGRLRHASRPELSGSLSGLARQVRKADLNAEMADRTSLRLVGLRRLEAAVAKSLKSGERIPETLRRLAGLTRVKYVFFDPEEREIVLAGPAEGWRYGPDGRAVGVESGEPLMHLDDLVVVLRSLAVEGDGNFGCSINTRDANLKQLKEFVEVSNRQGALRPGQLKNWLKELHDRLGLQDVVVHGVPPDTHVARVLVEADYRMKLIGVGQVDGGASIPSYFELLKQMRAAKGVPLEALRWWLTMNYDAILFSPDRNAFEFQGGAVRVQSENQFVNSQGQHVPTGVAEPINRAFAENFTNHYDDLARRDAVFADLRNVFDLALVAALLREERLLDRAGWNLGVFARGGAYQPAVVVAPQVVDSVIAHKVFNQTDIVVQVAGGVQIDLRETLKGRSAAQTTRSGEEASLPKLPPGRWWWNVSGR